MTADKPSKPASKTEQHEVEEEQTVSVFGHEMKKSDLFKAAGLVAFLVLVCVTVAALWPSLSLVFEEDGVDKMIESIQSQGALGVLILLGLQFLQIVVVFIPGEVVQVAAGMLYGPLWGTLLILFGCVVSSACIYQLVHRLGAPFVHAMVDKKYLEKFYEFETSGKLSVIVFILFLIPGMPKDAFTYLVPLTDMRMRTFLVLTTIGRTPGVIVSTYAAAGLAEGDITTSLIIFGVAAVLMILGILFRNKIMAVAGTPRALRKQREEREEREEAQDKLAAEAVQATDETQPAQDAPEDAHKE